MSYCLISKKPVNTLLSAIYFSFLDINTTVSQNIFYRKAFKNGIDFTKRQFSKNLSVKN